MSVHKRLRERRKAEQAELKRVTSASGFTETQVERQIVALPLVELR
jgi:hypothetical protein